MISPCNPPPEQQGRKAAGSQRTLRQCNTPQQCARYRTLRPPRVSCQCQPVQSRVSGVYAHRLASQWCTSVTGETCIVYRSYAFWASSARVSLPAGTKRLPRWCGGTRGPADWRPPRSQSTGQCQAPLQPWCEAYTVWSTLTGSDSVHMNYQRLAALFRLRRYLGFRSRSLRLRILWCEDIAVCALKRMHQFTPSHHAVVFQCARAKATVQVLSVRSCSAWCSCVILLRSAQALEWDSTSEVRRVCRGRDKTRVSKNDFVPHLKLSDVLVLHSRERHNAPHRRRLGPCLSGPYSLLFRLPTRQARVCGGAECGPMQERRHSPRDR